MTREEAIEWIKEHHDTRMDNCKDSEAMRMAIKALKNHDTFMKYAYSQGKQDALSQEPTEKPMCDRNICISNEYNGIGCDECIVNKAEQEPCDDAISREELLKAIDTWDKFGCDANTKLVPYKDHYIPYIHYDDVIECIKGMPSVTQKSNIKALGEELRKVRGGIINDKVLYGYNMAVAICNKHLGVAESEE